MANVGKERLQELNEIYGVPGVQNAEKSTHMPMQKATELIKLFLNGQINNTTLYNETGTRTVTLRRVIGNSGETSLVMNVDGATANMDMFTLTDILKRLYPEKFPVSTETRQ